jgi:DNA polymerase-3 subunit gamma/tau
LQFDGILAEGFENIHFISGLASHFRNLLVSKEPSTLELMDVPMAVRQDYQRQAQVFPANFLIQAIGLCTRTEASCRTALNARLMVELALLQLCSNAPASEAEKKKSERIDSSPSVQNPADSVSPAPPVAPDAKKETPVQEAPAAAPEKKANLFAPPPGMLNVASAQKDAQAMVRGRMTDQENPYTEEAFRKVWLEFAAQMNKDGKTALATLMQNAELSHKDGFVVAFSVGSALQLEWFNEVRSDMMIFLRQQLSNDKINFQIEVIRVETEHKPYTNAEKFRWMAKQNPDLENLRKQLDLDI